VLPTAIGDRGGAKTGEASGVVSMFDAQGVRDAPTDLQSPTKRRLLTALRAQPNGKGR